LKFGNAGFATKFDQGSVVFVTHGLSHFPQVASGDDAKIKGIKILQKIYFSRIGTTTQEAYKKGDDYSNESVHRK
jgi:hypothetical protein